MAVPSSAKVIDHLVGAMVAAGRESAGLTLKQLATKSGVPLADLKVYEAGGRRIPADALLRLAQALETPISYFFNAIDIADCAGLEGSLSQAIGPADCARVIQTFSLFRSHEAFNAALSTVRNMVVQEDKLQRRAGDGPEISSPGGV